jgi:hypothetical protein
MAKPKSKKIGRPRKDAPKPVVIPQPDTSDPAWFKLERPLPILRVTADDILAMARVDLGNGNSPGAAHGKVQTEYQPAKVFRLAVAPQTDD